MASGADFFLGHRQAQHRHVTLRRAHVAHRARRCHHRMYGLPGDFIHVTGSAFRIARHNAWMLDCSRVSDPGKEQEREHSAGWTQPPAKAPSQPRPAIMTISHIADGL